MNEWICLQLKVAIQLYKAFTQKKKPNKNKSRQMKNKKKFKVSYRKSKHSKKDAQKYAQFPIKILSRDKM